MVFYIILVSFNLFFLLLCFFAKFKIRLQSPHAQRVRHL